MTDKFKTFMDYKLMCEAKNDVLGKRDFNQIWENVNEAFESFNSKHITLERMQDVVKGYLLFLTEPMEEEIKLAAAIKVAENPIVKPWSTSTRYTSFEKHESNGFSCTECQGDGGHFLNCSKL